MGLALKNKLALSTGTAVLLVGIGLTVFNYYSNKILLETASTEQLRTVSFVFNGGLKQWLDGKAAALRGLPLAASEEDLGRALRQAKVAGSFDNVFLARSDGSQLNANGAQLPPDKNDPRKWDWYQKAQGLTNAVYFSTPTIAAATGQYVLSLGWALRDAGQVQAVAGADVGMQDILDQLKRIELPGDGSALLVNDQGVILGHVDTQRLAKPVTELYPALTAETIRNLAEQPGRRYIVAGNERLYAAPIDHSGEMLIMVLDERVLLAPLRHQLAVGVGICVLMLLISLALVYWLCSYLLRPLGVVSAGLQVIASGNGDLTRRIPQESDDEVGQLAGHFNQFVASLHGLVKGIRQHAEGIDGESRVVLDNSSSSSRELSRLQQEITLVATAVTEMASATQEIAGNAERTAGAIRQSSDNTTEGLKLVRLSQNSITRLADEVSGATQVINELQRHSQSIVTVLASIQGIAEQTNLLALNAAIEAARAGEHGRGFAVVADEVRTLSQRTQASTREIQETIGNLQQITQQAVQRMDTSRQMAERSVTDVQHASTALEEIASASSLISDMSLQIATAAEEQTSVTEEISRNVITIKGLGDTLATNAEGAEAQSRSLQHHAGDLHADVARFSL